MTKFNKKKEKPTIYKILDDKLKEAKFLGRTSFYIPLLEDEYKTAIIWAVHNNLIINLSHKTGNVLVYEVKE